MGNCLVHFQEDVVRIMKNDGKIIENKTPIKVHEVLKQFPSHAISQSLPHYLHHNTTLLRGHLYYLVPLPPQPRSPKVCNKRVRFAELHHDDEVEQVDHGFRIKLVVSKQELKNMHQNGGISVSKVLSLVQIQKRIDGADACNIVKDNFASQGWKPALETIPE